MQEEAPRKFSLASSPPQTDSEIEKQPTSKMSLSGRSQSVYQNKPEPVLPLLPRSASQSEALDKRRNSGYSNVSNNQTSKNIGLSTNNQSPRLRIRPVRSPPSPPTKTPVPSSLTPTASVDYDDLDWSTLRKTEKSADVFGDNKCRPPPLPRPARPARSPTMARSSSASSAPSEYERVLPDWGPLKPQVPEETPTVAAPTLHKSKSLSLHGDYDNIGATLNLKVQQPPGTDGERALAHPCPRPGPYAPLL
ncbi:hypothetical protein UPYG_G00093940 [Umbra pygmaea]|uniref:Uncharacterized protein n=1 Tax=Umbra pygmaea TaxID=75934 RepID=A0ABD0XJX9_UMBPY